AMFKMENINVPVLGIIENMSWFSPKEHKDEKYFIFGQHGGKDLATSLNLDLLGEIPLVQSIRESADVGRPAVLQQETHVESFYSVACKNLVLSVDKRNTELEETKVVPVEYGEPKCSTNG
ncbi:MAG: P-loop NTPase, partial [Bacteroidota bacterium]|nr:P-loop NTPase [Bacteroidota bacterium]